MIVKNEEKHLARCLASVKPMVDEIVIVDTGSSDRTKDIAAVFGATVFTLDWRDDYGQARNYALSKANGEWILILDADEVIAASDHEIILNCTNQMHGENCAYSFITRNYTHDVGVEGWHANDGEYLQETAGSGWYPSEKVRLFPNDDRFRFENAVHELVEPSLRRAGVTIKKCPVPVHHYGELSRQITGDKKNRYYALGKKKVAAQQSGPSALIEHAIQAQEVGTYEEAMALWQKVLKQCPDLAKAHFNMSYCYIQFEQYPQGLAAAKALELDPTLEGGGFKPGAVSNSNREFPGSCRVSRKDFAGYTRPPHGFRIAGHRQLYRWQHRRRGSSSSMQSASWGLTVRTISAIMSETDVGRPLARCPFTPGGHRGESPCR